MSSAGRPSSEVLSALAITWDLIDGGSMIDRWPESLLFERCTSGAGRIASKQWQEGGAQSADISNVRRGCLDIQDVVTRRLSPVVGAALWLCGGCTRAGARSCLRSTGVEAACAGDLI